jgi:Asp-tRNA(Asn)/Glu-tRNA(Gln) amidotransferase A subunit family amidase
VHAFADDALGSHDAVALAALVRSGEFSADGLPIGVQLFAAHGDERTLLELAYLLEAEGSFPRIEAAPNQVS